MTTVKMRPPAEVDSYPDDLRDRFFAALRRCCEDAETREEQTAAFAEVKAIMAEARHRRAN